MTKVWVVGFRLYDFQTKDGKRIEGAQVSVKYDDPGKDWDGEHIETVSLTGNAYNMCITSLAVNEPMWLVRESYTYQGQTRRSFSLLPFSAVKGVNEGEAF